MQSGIDTSRLRIAAETVFASQGVSSADAAQEKSIQAPTQSASLSFRDVLDTINPLNHIPIVSDIYSEAVGHKASPVAHLAGGALFGGPIGFVASLAGVIFEGETGASPAKAMYAALTDDGSTQLAMNDAAPVATTTMAEAPRAPTQEVAETTTAIAAPTEPVATANQAAALSPAAASVSRTSRIPIVGAIQNIAAAPNLDDAKAVLDLYGASPASAHGSYQKAQMLPYLRDVTVSKTL